jgi:hypothetical protein
MRQRSGQLRGHKREAPGAISGDLRSTSELSEHSIAHNALYLGQADHNRRKASKTRVALIPDPQPTKPSIVRSARRRV